MAVSHSAAGSALVSALGLAERLVPAESAAPARRPRIVLIPPPPAQLADPPHASGALVVRVDPRGFEGVFALANRIGEALEQRDAAEAWVRGTRTALAAISASSLGDARPHVAAVVSLDPLRIAGGRSLESELLEIAGAESVTHGGSEHRVPLARVPEEHREPALWLVFTPGAAGARERERAAAALPPGAAIALFPLPEGWLADPPAAAARLRARIAALTPPAG